MPFIARNWQHGNAPATRCEKVRFIAVQGMYAAGEKFTNSFGMNNWLPSFKQEFPYLCDSPSQTLQQVTKDLAGAYKNFFEKRADFPQFKKKGRSSDSFRFPQGFEIDEANRRIRLPKLGWIRYRKSRNIEGKAKNITVSHMAGKWYASIRRSDSSGNRLSAAGIPVL